MTTGITQIRGITDLVRNQLYKALTLYRGITASMAVPDPTPGVIESFELFNSLGSSEYSSLLKWKFTGTSITLNNTHVSQGTNAWRLTDPNFVNISMGDCAVPVPINLAAYSTLRVDVYWGGTVVGDNPVIDVIVSNTAFTQSVETFVTPNAGANTVALNLTTNPSLNLASVVISITCSFDSGTPGIDVWLDNARVS